MIQKLFQIQKEEQIYSLKWYYWKNIRYFAISHLILIRLSGHDILSQEIRKFTGEKLSEICAVNIWKNYYF